MLHSASDHVVYLPQGSRLRRTPSAAETDALVDLATTLGLYRADLDRLHRHYLTAIARAALADGVVAEAERQELNLVATLLHLPLEAVEDARTDAARTPSARRAGSNCRRALSSSSPATERPVRLAHTGFLS